MWSELFVQHLQWFLKHFEPINFGSMVTSVPSTHWDWIHEIYWNIMKSWAFMYIYVNFHQLHSWFRACRDLRGDLRNLQGSGHLPQSPGHFWRRLNLSAAQSLVSQAICSLMFNCLHCKAIKTGRKKDTHNCKYQRPSIYMVSPLFMFFSARFCGVSVTETAGPAPRTYWAAVTKAKTKPGRWVKKTRGSGHQTYRLNESLSILCFVTWNSNDHSIHQYWWK